MKHLDNNCEYSTSNSLDIQVKKNDCEIRADLMLGKPSDTVRLWGQIKDHYGNPVGNTLVKLLRVTNNCGKLEYEGIAHTISDCEGFYQFELEPLHQDCRYKILVGKAATGKERVLDSKGNCPPYHDDNHGPCNPCDPYNAHNPCNQGYKCSRMNNRPIR